MTLTLPGLNRSVFRVRHCAALALLIVAAIPESSHAQGQPAPRGPVRLDAALADSFARAARARPLPEARAARISTPPTIDGVLDEAMWKQAAPVTEFLQRELNEGVPATERTEIRFATDGLSLYIGARMYDREPNLIVPGEKIRDVTLANSDHIALIFDTYHDRQNGFVFGTTPAGVEYDGQVIREGEGGGANVPGQNRAQGGALGGFNVNWDASWTVATRIDSLGWTAEFRIPFSTLRYQAGAAEQTWGLNITRSIRRKNEELYWSFIPRQFNLYRLSLAGTLEKLTVPTRRIQTFTPYVLGSAQTQYPTVGSSRTTTPMEFGGEIKYGVTPALTLDLTYNTDFAQVEVDDQRVNLTRFPIFFPEKRPFFLENAGIFSAGTPQAIDPFFTRRIGISANGTPQPILGGGRLTGRVGKNTIGVLQMVTDAPDSVNDGQSYSVVRGIREISRRSRVGLMAVQRMSTRDAGDVNRTFVADSRIGIGQQWTGDVWAAVTTTPGRTGDASAYSARMAYQTNVWNHSLRLAQVGEDFNPEVGFLSRPAGFRQADLSLLRLVRKPEWSWFRQWNPHVNYRGTIGMDDFYQSGAWHIDLTEIEFANSARFGPEYNITHEGLQAPFEIAPGVILPPGSYDWGTVGFDYQTDPSENLWITGRFDVGEFWTGNRSGGSATVTVRSGATFSGSLTGEYNDVRLPQGNFIRTLQAVRLNYFFTPRLFVQTLTQYNNQQRIWSANVRLGWLNTAGTGLFVVLNDGREANGFFDWVRPQQRTVFVKFTRQFGTGG